MKISNIQLNSCITRSCRNVKYDIDDSTRREHIGAPDHVPLNQVEKYITNFLECKYNGKKNL